MHSRPASAASSTGALPSAHCAGVSSRFSVRVSTRWLSRRFRNLGSNAGDAFRLRGLRQYLSLVEEDAQSRIDPPYGLRRKRVIINAGSDELHDDGRVIVLHRVVYQL